VRADDDVVAKGSVIASDLWTEFGGSTSYKLVKYAVGMGIGSQVHASSSDRRLKENIQTISSPIERVQSLRGVTYGWNQTAKDYFIKDIRENVLPADSLSIAEKEAVWEEEEQKLLAEADRHTMSFIAQEVEEVFPEWVKENEEGYKEISMKGLNSLLVEAVKELKAEKDNEIQELKDEIAGLKSIINEILLIKD